MKRKFLSAATLLLMVGVFAPSPCAARKLRPEEKATIHSICVLSELGDEVHYIKVGTTIFNNHTDLIPAKEMLAGVKSGVEKALRSRGYSVVGDPAHSDYVLVISSGNNPTQESSRGARAAGIAARASFGMVQGVVVGGHIVFRLKDAKIGKIRASTLVAQTKSTRIRDTPSHWSEFTPEQQRTMLDILGNALLMIPEEGVQKMGL